MIKPRFVFALSFVVTAVCVWQTQVAAGQGSSPGVRCRLEPAPDSTLNATAIPSIMIPLELPDNYWIPWSDAWISSSVQRVVFAVTWKAGNDTT